MNNEINIIDIHLPAKVSIWPLSPFWWICLTVLIALIAAIYWYKGSTFRALKKQRKQYFKEAQSLLEKAKNTTGTLACAQKLNQLMKQLLINLYPQQNIAQLHDKQWLEKLAEVSAEHKFSANVEHILTKGLYQKENHKLENKALFYEVGLWLKKAEKHHV